jgi:thymidylate synthase
MLEAEVMHWKQMAASDEKTIDDLRAEIEQLKKELRITRAMLDKFVPTSVPDIKRR